MSEKLNKKDIVDILVAKNDISKEEAERFIAELFSLIEKGLAVDKLTKIKDFGIFKLTQIDERENEDINSKDKIVTPAHQRVTFAPTQLLEGLVNKPFSHFEATPLNDGVFMEGIPDISSSDKHDEGERYDEAEDQAKANELDGEATTSKTNSYETTTKAKSEEDKAELDDRQVELSTTVLASTTPSSEKSEDVTVTQEDSIEGVKEESSEVKGKDDFNVDASNQELINKPKAKQKRRRYIVWLNISIVLVVIVAVGFAYNHFGNNIISGYESEENETSKSKDDVAAPSSDTLKEEPVVIVDSVETAVPMLREKAKMSPGKTLRLIALDKLGNKEFWVYIYMINKDKIKNPNVVPVGVEIELPYENEYPMDANSPEEVAKAKKLGDEVMKSF